MGQAQTEGDLTELHRTGFSPASAEGYSNWFASGGTICESRATVGDSSLRGRVEKRTLEWDVPTAAEGYSFVMPWVQPSHRLSRLARSVRHIRVAQELSAAHYGLSS